MSEQAKHTPGPWSISEDGYIVAADGRRVGEYHGNPPSVFAEATRVFCDRALMAAAPDLLAALQEARDALFSTAPVTVGLECQIEAAIAKAEGRNA